MDAIAKWGNDNWLVVVLTIIFSVIAFKLGQVIISYLSRRISRVSARRNPNIHRKDIDKRARTLSDLFVTIWRIVVIALAALILFNALFPHVSLAPLFASAGVIGVVFGFGAQSLVKDFLSGVFIIAENQFRVGDIIEVDGFGGTVERIGARCTVFRDDDGNLHFFPNGQIQHVINKTMGFGMARFTISVAPNADLDEVINIINMTSEKMAQDPKWKTRIIDVPKFAVVSNFSANSVSLVVSGKTPPSDQWSVSAELRQRIFEALAKHKIPLGSDFPKLV